MGSALAPFIIPVDAILESFGSSDQTYPSDRILQAGAQIDCRDKWGQWHVAEIKLYKKPNTNISHIEQLNKTQQSNVMELSKLEGILIHYIG